MALYRKLTPGAGLKIPHTSGKYIYDAPNAAGFYKIPEGDETTDRAVALFVVNGILERVDGGKPEEKPAKAEKAEKPAKPAAPRKKRGVKEKLAAKQAETPPEATV